MLRITDEVVVPHRTLAKIPYMIAIVPMHQISPSLIIIKRILLEYTTPFSKVAKICECHRQVRKFLESVFIFQDR